MIIINNTLTEIRRCEKCLLPDHTPGIDFDTDGICSICATYKTSPPLGEDELLKALTARRERPNVKFDCIVPISGGLDSLYTAFYLVEKLGFKCKGIYYNNGMLSNSGEDVLQWIESNLGIPITRKSVPAGLSRKLVRNGLKSLLDFGPMYMQAALCRHCGYGIRASVYGEMVSYNQYSVWGMHNMDEMPFRYCLNVKPNAYIFQKYWLAVLMTYVYRYKQMKLLPSPGVSPFRLISNEFGYPELPEKYAHLKVLSFFDFIPWNKSRMIKELNDAGIDTSFLETTHSDCVLSPVVDHVLRHAWGIGKKEVYICNRVRVGQLSKDEGIDQIEALLGEELDTSVLSDLGMTREQITSIFRKQPKL